MRRLESKQASGPGEVMLARRTFLGALLAGIPMVGALTAPLTGAVAQASIESSLEMEIERYIKSLRRKRKIEGTERTAWSVYDFSRDRKLVAINEDVPFQSASMIKPFIALAYFYKRREEPRRFPYGPRTRRRMERMIRDSNNKETNHFIDLLDAKCGRYGPRTVEMILKNRAPGVFQQTSIVERVPRGGRSYRNKASAHDYSRFLYALWNRHFPGSDELLRLMALENNDRLFRGARRIPYGTDVYDKTGTTAKLCGNMGILATKGRNGKRYPYTLIGIIERRERAVPFGPWVANRGDVIREVSNIVYDYQKQFYPLR
ncbi:MAG: serine hydrolase [Candidatus Eisenbacteria bacterium]|nr:serine hydrolase [Candidatus Latescibacterota bacterium]MBD3302199.1 serine hydrolase [Candidatus Eisenbacteria bacterium]